MVWDTRLRDLGKVGVEYLSDDMFGLIKRDARQALDEVKIEELENVALTTSEVKHFL